MEKRIIIEIKTCTHCPYCVPVNEPGDIFLCEKLNDKKLPPVSDKKLLENGYTDYIIPIPSDCPQDFTNFINS